MTYIIIKTYEDTSWRIVTFSTPRGPVFWTKLIETVQSL